VPRWLSSDEQQAWRGLLEMTARLQSRLGRALQDTSGLSLPDYEVLVALSESEHGRLRVFEIAKMLAWEQSRLSHHLARMEQRGLVERQPCDDDRRGAHVVLTGPGRAAIERAAPAHVEEVRRLVFDGLSPEQVAALTEVTAVVLGRLETPEGA
jgi:DNA-binding MarR family transcriptional regulator